MTITFSPEQDQYLQLAQTHAYYQGLREGIEQYAWWKDGKQFVGTTGKLLEVALYEISQEQEQILKRFSGI